MKWLLAQWKTVGLVDDAVEPAGWGMPVLRGHSTPRGAARVRMVGRVFTGCLPVTCAEKTRNKA